MPIRSAKSLKITIAVLAGVGLVGIAAAAVPLVKSWLKPTVEKAAAAADPERFAELVPDEPHALRLSPAVARKLGVVTTEGQKAPPPEPLKLAGSLFLDPSRLARVHARFAGEVVEIGMVEATCDNLQQPCAITRLVRFGDLVNKDQLLAVVWSKDLGEKKSELVDALSRLRLDQGTLQRLEELYRKGAIPERSVREADRNVEADLIAVARAERTLRSWRLTDAEIETVKAEAGKVRREQGPQDTEREKQWARVEVRAPFAGVVLEKNIAPGDVVDTSLDLFKIADLSCLEVLAHAYEEDLTVLQSLGPQQRRWRIYLKSDPEAKPFEGTFDQIGQIIDPNQHTALVMGWVDNPQGRLRVGQFISAAIDLPPPPNQVMISKTALIEDGHECGVFVAPDANEPCYIWRKVLVVRRGRDGVFLRSEPTADERCQGFEPLAPGERVVSAGAVELAAALKDLQASIHTGN
jgi:cobalt-zinc-cadmium efflux system membrane fusion protein